MGLFYLFLWLVWISDITGIIVTIEVYTNGPQASGTGGIPYDFSIFIAALVGVVAIFAFFPVGLLVFSHTRNFIKGKTTSETLSKAAYKVNYNEKTVWGNCVDMCCDKESGAGFMQAKEKYKKDLEVTLKDYN